MLKKNRRFLLPIGLLLIGLQASAQKKNTVNAAMDYKNAESAMYQGNTADAKTSILSAKNYIDQSVVDPTTKEDPKTLMYKGKIYMVLLNVAQMLPEDEELKPFMKEETGNEAIQAFKDAKQFDPKGRYNAEIDEFLAIYRNSFLNAGIQLYQRKDYEDAYSAFAASSELARIMGVVDTVDSFNAALSAELSGKYDEAATLYKHCADLEYRVPDIYVLLSSSLRKAGKTEEAMNTVKEARKKYPLNKEILIEMVNISLEAGDHEAAEKSLNDAIEADPENKQLHFTVGTVYDNLGKYDEAEKAYNKALELDENYFDALYNLGALYFNKGVEINEKAQTIKDNDAFQVEKDKADAEFKKSLPYLERAHAIDPEDRNTMISLKQLYPRMGMNDKFMEINEKLKN